MTVETLIVGAGPTGLGAALRCVELDREFVLFDSAQDVGGLATSHVDRTGFTWDIGGHVQFSHYRYFDDVMDWLLGDAWNELEREAWVWLRGRFIPYPFQNNLRYLPPEESAECLVGLIEAAMEAEKSPRRPAHFGEWMLATFGPGITKIFMEPYNFKVWAHPVSDMDFGWIGERVAVPSWTRATENIVLGRDDFSWGPNNTFRFPQRGGTGAIWRTLAARLPAERLRLDHRLVGLDLDGKIARFTSGSGGRLDVPYRDLISTIPITELAHISDPAPPIPTSPFLHSSVNVVGLGLAGAPPPKLATKCWMYFPEPDSPFFRATVFSNYSDHNVARPGEQWSLMFEISESPHRPVDQDVIGATIRGAMASELIGHEDAIVTRHHFRSEHGYPTPFLGRDAVVDPLLAWFEERQVRSRGRFGAWKYEVSNQDHSMMQGVEAVDAIAGGDEEDTLRRPVEVNERRCGVNDLRFDAEAFAHASAGIGQRTLRLDG